MHEISDWLQWTFAPILAIGGWIMRRLHMKVDILETEISDHRLHVSQNYMPKADFQLEVKDMRDEMRSGMREIKDGMTRIYDKLDGKADKPSPMAQDAGYRGR